MGPNRKEEESQSASVLRGGWSGCQRGKKPGDFCEVRGSCPLPETNAPSRVVNSETVCQAHWPTCAASDWTGASPTRRKWNAGLIHLTWADRRNQRELKTAPAPKHSSASGFLLTVTTSRCVLRLWALTLSVWLLKVLGWTSAFTAVCHAVLRLARGAWGLLRIRERESTREGRHC